MVKRREVKRREVKRREVVKKNFTPKMSEPQPPPSNDIISMFNNLVNYLKSHTVDDETTRKDVANVITTSEHIVTYLSTLTKKEEDIEVKEEKKSNVIEDIVNPMCNVVDTIPDVPQEIRIGINEISREVGRSVFYKMTPQTKFQKVFSSFLKRLLFSNGDDSNEIEVNTYFSEICKFIIYNLHIHSSYPFFRNVVLSL
jgi:hypothetical protein